MLVLALVLTGCAHEAPEHAAPDKFGPVSLTAPRFAPHQLDRIDAPRESDADRCAGKEEVCFARGMEAIHGGHLQDGFVSVLAACYDGSSKACAFLNAHVSPPKARDPVLPPGYPRLAIEHDVTGKLVIRCRVPLDGRLTGCVVAKPLPYVSDVFVRWFTGKKMDPARLDGTPIAADFLIAVTLSRHPAD